MKRPKFPPSGLSGTARAARSRRLAGAKRIEAVLKPEALAELRERTGRTYSAIIEEALLAVEDLQSPRDGLENPPKMRGCA